MKNLLSKTLLCGVLATSFVLINCQKAPTRPLQAGTGEGDKPGTLGLKIAEKCTENEITKYDAAMAAIKALDTLTKKENPTEADKAEMSAKLTDLEAKIKASKDAIAALKVGKDLADACNKVGADPAKPEVLKAAEFDEAFVRLTKLIKDLGAAVPPSDGVTDPVVDVLKTDDRIELSDELVALYNDSASGCISNGKRSTAEECGQFKADSTVCKVTGDGAAVDAKAKGKILVNAMAAGVAPKRNSLKILVSIEAAAGSSSRATSIDCDLADGVTAEKAPEAVTRALGNLVSKVPAEEQKPADPAPADPKPADPAPAASTPAPAPADNGLAARAQAALPLLGTGPQ